MSLPVDQLATIANESRGLAIDAVAKCNSGHLGLPLGCAEMGAVLFGSSLNYSPANPKWLNRDRFILSAGHGSAFIYIWLHLSGFAVSLDEVKAFRAMGSITPGHPEYDETPGVEATTGPLGQGVSNIVGYAVSQKMAAARYNTASHKIFDNKIVGICGDGCMQEGVAMEAISFAGHNRLDNIIMIYDDNEVTLDAMADATQSEDCQKRMEATGWNVIKVDGHDMNAFAAAYAQAKAYVGKPTIIMAKTVIGKGISEVAGTNKAHGEGGKAFAAKSKEGLGLPDSGFYVSDATKAFFKAHADKQNAKYTAWEGTYKAWKAANPALATELESAVAKTIPSEADLFAAIPAFDTKASIATRKAGGDTLQHIAKKVPNLVGGSADLFGSTLNYIKEGGDFTPSTPAGRNIRFGIREHAMCGIMNGIAYDTIFRAEGATFMVFSDYCRASIRVAALSHLPNMYIFTHDSIGVGEDGPTHQPVETVPSLRLIPNLDVIKPGDPEETAAALVAGITRTNGPTMLSLSRQAVFHLDAPVATKREGTLKGGYIAVKETGPLKAIVIGCGSELGAACTAAKELGGGVRVVSMPSPFRFDAQPADYKESVLPSSCEARVAVEAAATSGWYKYVGLHGKVIGIDRFGMSAPGGKVMEALGINAKSVVAAVNELTSEPASKRQKTA